MKNLLLVLLLLPFYALQSQSYSIGHTTATFTDAARNNRSIPVEIYYPANTAGENVAAANGKFPVLSFGHGFVMTWDAYQNIWEAVAPAGYILVFPKTEGSLGPSHGEFGKDLAFVLTEMITRGDQNTSLFYGHVDTLNAVMGHSMGGGAAFLAAQNPVVKSLVTLAPAETTPSAIQAAATLNIPSLVFSGSNDCVTPPPAHQIPMYNALASTCKTYISITGGSHCQMADNNLLCSFGEATCTPAPAITRTQQHDIINRYLVPWLNHTLKGDCPNGARFDSLITTDASITFQKNCQLCPASAIPGLSESMGLTVTPNPFRNQVTVQIPSQVGEAGILELYAPDGRKISAWQFSPADALKPLQLEVPAHLPSGLYVLLARVNGQCLVQKLIRQ